MSDEELFRQFLTGDSAAAFREIHNRYAEQLERLCFRRLRNAEDAKDAAQEALLVLLRRKEQLQPIDLGHFLRRVARFCSQERIRKRRAEDRCLRQLVTLVHDADPQPEIQLENIDAQARTQAVLQAVAAMKPRPQELLRRHFLLGVTIKEIAKSLGISEHATRARLSRAVKRLASSRNLDSDANHSWGN